MAALCSPKTGGTTLLQYFTTCTKPTKPKLKPNHGLRDIGNSLGGGNSSSSSTNSSSVSMNSSAEASDDDGFDDGTAAPPPPHPHAPGGGGAAAQPDPERCLYYLDTSNATEVQHVFNSYSSYFVFTFVRNVLARAVSSYVYIANDMRVGGLAYRTRKPVVPPPRFSCSVPWGSFCRDPFRWVCCLWMCVGPV